jgi:hypothetical protein
VDHQAEFVVMEFQPPAGGNLLPVAVLLLVRSTDRLHIRSCTDLSAIDQFDAELLQLYFAQLAGESEHESGSAIMGQLEDSLSNSVRITDRQPIAVDDVSQALDGLCRRYLGADQSASPRHCRGGTSNCV